MPSHVAMKGPHARVVEVNLDHEVAAGLDELCVPTLRVTGVDYGLVVPRAASFGEDLHVVAVDVHRVAGREADAGHDDADGRVGAQVVHGALGRVVVVAQLGFQQRRVIVVAVEGDVVHVPDEGSACVVPARHYEIERHRGLFHGNGECRDGSVERLIVAVQRKQVPG